MFVLGLSSSILVVVVIDRVFSFHLRKRLFGFWGVGEARNKNNNAWKALDL